jgi:hypothetical protein
MSDGGEKQGYYTTGQCAHTACVAFCSMDHFQFSQIPVFVFVPACLQDFFPVHKHISLPSLLVIIIAFPANLSRGFHLGLQFTPEKERRQCVNARPSVRQIGRNQIAPVIQIIITS